MQADSYVYGGKSGKVVVTVGNMAASADVRINDRPSVSPAPSVTSGKVPLTVNFKANCEDSDGNCVSFSWDFGDGLTSTEENPSHTYQNVGIYKVRLKAVDNDGGGDSSCYSYGGITIAVSSFDLTLVSSFNVSSAYGIYVAGTSAYLTTSSGVFQTINVSNPSSPALSGTLALNSFTVSNPFVAGNYAYIANGSSGLLVLDVSNPNSPSKKGSLDTIGTAVDVFVSGTTAYALVQNSGLKIIDVTDSASPSLKGSYASSSYPYAVYVSNNYAYISDYTGLKIIDVSNASSPFLKGSYSLNYSYDVFVSGNYAYVISSSELRIVDISNPGSPSFKGSYTFPSSSSYFYSIYVSGNYAYVADPYSSLYIIDVSNVSAPKFAAAYTNVAVRNIFVDANYIYVTSMCGYVAAGVKLSHCTKDGLYIFSKP